MVKIIFLTILMNILVVSTVMAQHQTNYLAKADSLFKIQRRKKAKIFYIKAAKQGNAKAHFALGYKYNLPRKKRLFHFVQAAKAGNGRALKSALEILLFRSGSLRKTKPKRALDLYRKTKKAHPNLKFFGEKEMVKTMKMAAVTSDFNGNAFMKKYNITPVNKSYKAYYIWQLAEKASRPGGKFGKPNPQLVLALVVRGVASLSSKINAIETVYKNYKKGIVKPFHICDFVEGGAGMYFCASRMNKKDALLRKAKLDSLKNVAGKTIAPLIQKAYEKAVAFIDAKATLVELHAGSGRPAFIIFSEMNQKNHFLDLIERVQNGFKPQLSLSFPVIDQNLNETYQKALKVLGEDLHLFSYFTKPEDLRKVERLWIPFRDATATALHALEPEIKLKTWKALLTKRRIDQLKHIPGMEKCC